MLSVETMTLGQINALMAELRTRRKTLKSSGKVNQQKITTLARRRECLLTLINAIDEQIIQLRDDQQDNPQPASDQRRTRRSQAEVTLCLNAILECAQRHTVINRATIIDKCHLSPITATAYLRQLCLEGRLVRCGDKRATTYSLP